MNSPPKRMTRARAAAKSNASGPKTTKIMTAAAQARLVGSSIEVVTTQSKRKTREDDTDGDGEEAQRYGQVRRLRSRPSQEKHTSTEEPKPAASKTTRSRLTKSNVTATANQAAAPLRQPATRARKQADIRVTEPEKKTTRSRTNSVTKQPMITKKAVKFEGSDKENIEPPQKTSGPETAGLKSRPARKAPRKENAPKAKSSENNDKTPLSPKKVTQMPVSRDVNCDELVADVIEVFSTYKNNSVKGNAPPLPSILKKTESDLSEKDLDSTITVNAAILNTQEFVAGLASPPRRPPASPSKDALRSPAKKLGAVAFPPSALRPLSRDADELSQDTTMFKSALWQTPAKRPKSPIKGMVLGSTQKPAGGQSALKSSMFQSPAKRCVPGLKSLSERFGRQLCETPAMKTLAVDKRRPSERLTDEEAEDSGAEQLADELLADPIQMPKFTGRLSSVLLREADPTAADEMEPVDEEEDDEINLVPIYDYEADADSPSLSIPVTPVRDVVEEYQLSPTNDLRSYDLPTLTDTNMLPNFGTTNPVTPEERGKRRETIGISELANQLGTWTTAGPMKTNNISDNLRADENESILMNSTPMRGSFFEDEMQVHGEPTNTLANVDASTIQEPEFNDIIMTEEDVALAREANHLSFEMSEHHQTQIAGRSFDDSISEASQEYGDENEVPVDPAMLNPVTPGRPALKTFGTTTKVPLKPADNSTPSPVKKRGFTGSRISARGSGSSGAGSLPKSATVISYSPTKEKTDLWSTKGRSSQTPQRDSSPSLLRGAVVFVDVHTSEGADASGIFVDLLQQMGARCVKTWNWNPSSGSSGASAEGTAANRVGITHVVFKDGGKRTMERVRVAKGVVQCVGVSWVLDCERENEWLDEAPYLVDASFVPRGGARRRKSMEPKALANHNGTVVQTPSKPNASSLTTPYNRRQSAIWVHTPSDQGDDIAGDDDVEWSKFILTPVSKTPAPPTISIPATEIPMTPSFASSSTSNDASPTKVELLMRTCPPKALPIRQMGDGFLSPEKDEQVMLKLMAARRKSMQFAPKIGSPLARTWQ